MNAYDYDRQTWVSGGEARALLARQLDDELKLLKSERGASYAKMLGKDHAALILDRERARKAL